VFPPRAFLAIVGLALVTGLAQAQTIVPAPAASAQGSSLPAAAIGAELQRLELDPDTCYRVRDFAFERPDVRFFIADGWIIFAKPVAGHRVLALYQASESTDDAEVMVRPSDRSERASMAQATGSPNIDEHFNMAILVFTSGGDDMLKSVQNGGGKLSAERGLLLASDMNPVVQRLASGLSVRIAYDVLSNATAQEQGFLYAALAGRSLGTFNVLYDPMKYEQILVSGVKTVGKSTKFDIWASFPSRASLRTRALPPPDATLTNYRIECTIRPDLKLEVVMRATLRAQRRVQGAIALDLSPRMQITSAKVDGQGAEVFRGETARQALAASDGVMSLNDQFLIGLAAPVEPGQTREIEVRNEGYLIRKTTDGVFFVEDRVSWYPTLGQIFSTYDLIFHLPKQYLLAAPGDIVEETVEGDVRMVHRRCTQPIRNAGFNIGNYQHVDVKRGDYRVDMYANRKSDDAPHTALLPQDVPSGPASPPGAHRGVSTMEVGEPSVNVPARMAEVGAEIAEEFEWMAAHFGPPPLKRIAISPIPGTFGQGFPGLIYLSTVTYLDDAQRRTLLRKDVNADTFYGSIIHAHETAHQWWGNLVVPATYHDEWIVEALANYTAMLVLEQKRGERTVDLVLEDYRRRLIMPGKPTTVESYGPITWGYRLRENGEMDPWRAIIYGKGTWIIHMMRRRMGDDAFLRMLATLRKRYEYRTVTTEEFRTLAAMFLPPGDPDPKLENFFDTWVYGTGVPALEMTTSVKGKAPSVVLTVTVKQSDVPDDFVTEVPVEIRTAGGKPLVKWAHTSSTPSVIVVKLPAPPQRVELAPRLAVLAKTK
jgi:hypothetical protein